MPAIPLININFLKSETFNLENPYPQDFHIKDMPKIAFQFLCHVPGKQPKTHAEECYMYIVF